MNLYRFYLDGSLLADEPLGWKELTTSIRNYDEIRGILITQDVTLSFVGDGYTYLKGIFDSDQVCALSTIVIEYNCNNAGYEEVFRGIVFITSLSFENEICKTKLEDDSFFARINNNKNIKAYLDVARSKNSTAISAVTPIDLTMFDVCTCADEPDTRKAYTIFDSFQYLLQFMTDGVVSFASDYFGVGGPLEGHVIQTGLALRDINYTADKKNIPYISFFELYKECNIKNNLTIGIEYSGATPILRIEPYEYFFTSTASVILSNPLGVKISTDISKLYAKVKVGSDKTEPFQDCTQQNPALFPENTDFVGFREEEFPLLTQCNTDSTLDLVSSWVISSNAIQHVLTDDPSYDEDMFFIQADRISPTAHTATQTDVFNDGNCYYNAFYNNMNVLQRWNSALPNNVIVILGSSNNTFTAIRRTTSGVVTVSGVGNSYTTTTVDGNGNLIEPYNDDWDNGYDGCVLPCPSPNNYGNGTVTGTDVSTANSRYTVPNNGNYRFNADVSLIDCKVTPGPFQPLANVDLTVFIHHYDSANALVQNFSSTLSVTFSGTPQTFVPGTITPIIACTAGDYFLVSYQFTITALLFTAGIQFRFEGEETGPRSFFQCLFSQGFGGQLTQVVNTDFRNIQFDFNYPLSYANYKAIKADTKKFIQFNYCNKNYTGYIKDVQYKPHNNSKLTLLTSKNGYRNNP